MSHDSRCACFDCIAAASAQVTRDVSRGGRRVSFSLDGGKTQRAIVKACACGLSFTAHEWSLLAFVGTMMDPEATIELRNCPCGSTIAIEAKP